MSSEQSSATLANADSLLARLLMASNNSHNGNYMLANIQQSTPGVQCDTVSSLVGGTSNLLDLKLAQQQQQQQQQQNSRHSTPLGTKTLNSYFQAEAENLKSAKQSAAAAAAAATTKTTTTSELVRQGSSLRSVAAASATASVDGGGDDQLSEEHIKDHKDELDTEFDQAFKRLNRVKDNYNTHMKFMDIVKS